MKVLAIAGVNGRRFLKDRAGLFYVVVLPMALIVLTGLQFGGDPTPRLGLVGHGGPLAAELRAREVFEIVDVPSEADLVGQVEAGTLDAGVVVPAALTGADGRPATVGFVAGTSPRGQQARAVVGEALAKVLVEITAAQAAVSRGVEPSVAAATAERLAPAAPSRVRVRTVSTGERLFPEGVGGYDVAAPSQLVLFVFVTGLTGAAALIQTRGLGVSARMLSTPTSARSIIAGEALGRYYICLFQGVYVLLGTLLLFGVDWGDPLGAAAIIAMLCAVSAAAAMLFGALFQRPEQASGIGLIVGLCLAALGGAMMPVELFSDTLASVARLTPHYWALDAFAQLIRHGANVVDVLPQLAVLAAYAVVLMLLASWRMRVVLTRSPV